MDKETFKRAFSRLNKHSKKKGKKEDKSDKLSKANMPDSLKAQTAFVEFAIRHMDYNPFSDISKKDEPKWKRKKKYSKIKRPEIYIKDVDIFLPGYYIEDRLLAKRIILYPEAIPYLFNLEGCPKKLFLYLLIFRQDVEGQFKFNSSDIALFNQFCELYPPKYNEDTVRQAMKYLRDKNIVLNLKRGLNMMNPMITGGNSEQNRIRLIKEYNFQLLQQGLSPFSDFYPTR